MEWNGSEQEIFLNYLPHLSWIVLLLKSAKLLSLNPNGVERSAAGDISQIFTYLWCIVLLLWSAEPLIYEPQRSGAGNISKILLYSWWG